MSKRAKLTGRKSKANIQSKRRSNTSQTVSANPQKPDFLTANELRDPAVPLKNKRAFAKYIGRHYGNHVLQRMLTVNAEDQTRVARKPQSPDDRIRNRGPIASTPPATTMIPRTVGEIQSQVNSFIDLKKTITNIANVMKDKSRVDLVAAENLLSAAGNIAELTQIYQEYSKKLQELPAEKVATRIGKIQSIIGHTKLVAALANNRALQAFKADPTNLMLAFNWANDAADTFEKVADLVPAKIPFVSSMLKRTLAAPAVYVRAFNNLLTARIAKIDVYADIGDKMKYGSGKSSWTGHLARLFGMYSGLQSFMIEHRNVDNIDLEKVHGNLGSAHLINLIERYPYWDSKKKYHYINIIHAYVKRYQSTW